MTISLANVAEPSSLALLFVIFLVAGTVKGTVGIGLPTVALALMVQIVPVKIAMALIVMPMIIANIPQTFMGGLAGNTFKRYWLMIGCLMIFLFLTSRFLPGIDSRSLVGMVGLAVVSYAIVDLVGKTPRIYPPWDKSSCFPPKFARLAARRGLRTA